MADANWKRTQRLRDSQSRDVIIDWNFSGDPFIPIPIKQESLVQPNQKLVMVFGDRYPHLGIDQSCLEFRHRTSGRIESTVPCVGLRSVKRSSCWAKSCWLRRTAMKMWLVWAHWARRTYLWG